MQTIDLDIVCTACSGTGLYVGLAERDGTSVVCHQCKGSGKYAYHFEYEPFEHRADPPPDVTRVHVSRGYVLSPNHPDCDGGMPVGEYEPGVTVPADEKLYCPYLYTSQGYCAKPEKWHPDYPPEAPLLAGQHISECKHWGSKAECWVLFQAEAPADMRRQVS